MTVSITAVSKWERSECYPDIEFLPKIAAYYDVSVDDLLGVGEIRKKEKINEYERRSYYDKLSDTEKYAMWREAQKEFPNEWLVLYNFMYALFEMYVNEKVDIQKKKLIPKNVRKLAKKFLLNALLTNTGTEQYKRCVI